MTIAVESQALAFLCALAAGALLGLFYDLLRPFRISAPQWKEWALDFFFWIVVTLTVFISAPLFENGQIRIYMLLGNILGALCYFKLLSRPIRAVCTRLCALYRRVRARLLRPFRRLYLILSAPLLDFFNSVKNHCKKRFLFPRGWVKMKRISEKAGTVDISGEEGHWHEEQSVYHQKGWSSLEDRGGGSAGLHHLYDGAHAGENRGGQ